MAEGKLSQLWIWSEVFKYNPLAKISGDVLEMAIYNLKRVSSKSVFDNFQLWPGRKPDVTRYLI